MVAWGNQAAGVFGKLRGAWAKECRGVNPTLGIRARRRNGPGIADSAKPPLVGEFAEGVYEALEAKGLARQLRGLPLAEALIFSAGVGRGFGVGGVAAG